MEPQRSGSPTLDSKRQRLAGIIRDLGEVVVAFSGGTDSSYLLAACVDVLGAEHVLAITVDSPLLPRADLAMAQAVARALAARHQVLAVDELQTPEIRANPPDRCYHCKRQRFLALQAIAESVGGAQVVHGENVDDHHDYRPGSVAARELGVRAPLAEAGLTKAEIRALSRERGLPTWSLPAAACLASRVPYGTPLSAEALRRIELAEEALHVLLPDQQLRVRDHHPLARVELELAGLSLAVQEPLRTRICARVRAAGYRYVTLDLDGYRMGSLNEEIVDRSQHGAGG
ncbi:MAG: ATP-dependent sacrificial sulfur transferase LarE [Chloroflexi bacterium]|nr:ATP-dependent sacrificial sulfur transferase LarE [Chloroflexota bacterium]